MDEIEKQLMDINKSLGEAGGIAWTELYGWSTDENGVKHQVKINVTARDLTSTLALEQLFGTLKVAKESYHLHPYAPSAPKLEALPQQSPKEDPFADRPEPVYVPVAKTPKSGAETFHCVKIQAGPYKDNIKLDFYTDIVGKSKFPYVTQYISIERALSWFQPFGDFKAEHFTNNQEIAMNLNVTFELSDKLNSKGTPYKNVIKIEAA